jgi:hypothetical protein
MFRWVRGRGKELDLFSRLEKHWYAAGTGSVAVRPPHATESEIADFERINGLTLPPDLREYFLRFNGTDDDGDAKLFCFKPIEKLCSLHPGYPALNDAEYYFIFADFMIDSWYYAIYLGNNPSLQHKVILPDFPNHPEIAPDFSAFLELYLNYDPKLYGNA